MESEADIKPRPRRRYRRRAGLAGVLIAIVAALIASRSTPVKQAIIQSQPGMLTVTHVNDGDTIVVREPDGHDETVRLIGVDTPEVKDPRKPVQCFGEAASAHTKSVIKVGSGVRLAPDPEDSDRDKYNRLLRYVYLPDGTLYNEQLIKDGYGFAYVVFPFSKLDQFRADEAAARQANKGLWGGCQVDSSQDIKQTAGAK
jgi:micrococcal nuclease